MKYKILIKYNETMHDSDTMRTDKREDETHQIEVSCQKDILNFLLSLEDVAISPQILKELEEDNDFDLNSLDKMYTDYFSKNWVHTDFILKIKTIN